MSLGYPPVAPTDEARDILAQGASGTREARPRHGRLDVDTLLSFRPQRLDRITVACAGHDGRRLEAIGPTEDSLHQLQNVSKRPRAAKLYIFLITLTPLVILLQGFLFGGFNADRPDRDFLDAHLWVGRISFVLLVVAVTPAALMAGFDRASKIVPMTILLAALWIVQAGLGEGTEDVEWFSAIHVPLGIAMFGLAVLLTGKTHRLARSGTA